MGVGHPDKKLDKMAQDAIDSMSGSNRSTGKKKSKGSTIFIIAVILFLYLWLQDFSINSCMFVIK